MDEGLVQLAHEPDRDRLRSLTDPGEDKLPDPLRSIEQLRRQYPQWSASFASAVASQRELTARALGESSLPTRPWLLTRTGLEQSTRPEVAQRRATVLAAAGIASVVDLTAGLGVDSWAFTEAGLQVLAIEQDPLTAELCRANVPAARVVHGEAADYLNPHVEHIADLPRPLCWFVDPARRGRSHNVSGRRAAPERDPDRWSPPWSLVEEMLERGNYVAAKAPGGFTPDRRWDVEWVASLDYVAECAVYHLPQTPLSFPRQATLLTNTEPLTFEVSEHNPPEGPLQAFIAEPHPVFHRALAALCEQGMRAIAAQSTWLTAESPHGRGVRWYRVMDTAPVSGLRSVAERNRVSAVALKSRESNTPMTTLRKKVGLPDGNRYAYVFVRGSREAILVERL